MKTLGWSMVLGGVLLQFALPLRVIVPPQELWLGTPSTILLMFIGLLTSCFGVVALYFGGLRREAERLDAELAARPAADNGESGQ